VPYLRRGNGPPEAASFAERLKGIIQIAYDFRHLRRGDVLDRDRLLPEEKVTEL
jgi:hypothetical protein